MEISKKILLIDDDPDDQLFFRDAIQTISPEINCSLASSCQEAIRLLELPPNPDIIFMDLNMPVMNGFDCLIYLKNQLKYKDIPIVIFTTSKNMNDIRRTQSLGANWYMTKPDDFNLLCKKLNRIFINDLEKDMYTI